MTEDTPFLLPICTVVHNGKEGGRKTIISKNIEIARNILTWVEAFKTSKSSIFVPQKQVFITLMNCQQFLNQCTQDSKNSDFFQPNIRDLSTEATGMTAVAPKFSNTLTLFQPGRCRFYPTWQRLHQKVSLNMVTSILKYIR